MEAVRRWLDVHDNWLLLCDNADKPVLLREYRSHNPTGHILVTSRATNFDTLQIRNPVTLDKWSRKEAIEFLLNRVERTQDQWSPQEWKAVEELVDELDGLPLALEQAAAFIVTFKTPFHRYLQDYRKAPPLQTLEQRGEEATFYPRSVATTWRLNFTEAAKTPGAAETLYLSAFLAPDDIPTMFLVPLPDAGWPQTILLKIRRRPDSYACLKALGDYSLIRRDLDRESFSLHRLVQAVLQQTLSVRQRRQWAIRAVEIVAHFFPASVEFENWSTCDRLLLHAQVCTETIERYHLTSATALQLLHGVGHYLFQRGRYMEAEASIKRVYDVRCQRIGANHPDTMATNKLLADLHRAQGRYADAQPLYEEIVNWHEKTQGKQHPAVAGSLNDLAVNLFNQKQYDRAEPLFERALLIMVAASRRQDVETALVLNNQANMYRVQARYADAARSSYQAQAILERAYGSKHPAIAAVVHDLGLLQMAQGDLDGAELHFRRALEMRQETLIAEHPDLAISMHALASLYTATERYAEAEPLFRDAVNIRERMLGSRHPDTLRNLSDLADLYRAQGRFGEAEPLLQKVLLTSRKIWGSNHFYTASAIRSLARLYLDQGMGNKAVAYLQQGMGAIVRTIDADPATIAQTFNDLTEFLRLMERPDDAAIVQILAPYAGQEQLKNTVIKATRSLVLEPNPANTAFSLNELGATLSRLGRHEEAEPLERRALAIREKVLGPEHPDM